MNKNKYLLLLIICISTAVLVAIGMPEYSKEAAKRAQNGASSLIPLNELPIMVNVSGLLSFVVAIWGVIMAFRRRQWLWLVSFVFLSYLSVGMYALLNFIRLHNKEKKIVA
ncbi:hypothetical protein MUG87_11280 [Ectobacillus sp. JY-23]|uniref:hypothetical protein n=1 Tax=Ectobacillus sp. JY-23 TaxID=2933872 RepID=UPI001FF55286|nr:hypothetical protein [Ectobacillus sp. JY-23]UOY91143.1 hypothetical protein MUG87_11280 [Ectobacillus sp. JY-23]